MKVRNCDLVSASFLCVLLKFEFLPAPLRSIQGRLSRKEAEEKHLIREMSAEYRVTFLAKPLAKPLDAKGARADEIFAVAGADVAAR